MVVSARGGAQQAPAPEGEIGVLVVEAANEATQGAAVRVDGEPAGNVPYRVSLEPGRHLIQVGRRGFVTFSKWVDVEKGQVLTVAVALESKAAQTGSLTVTADVTGLPVFVDGQQRGGTPLVIDGLSEGEHQVEIRSPGEGYRAFSELVRVTAGGRTSIDATLREAPDLGSLRVITNIPGAMISLDGQEIGLAPTARGGLQPGDHQLIARAEGYEPVEQTVSVIAGRERVVSMRLTTPTTGDLRISVNSNLDEATVFIDGEDYGAPPIVLQPAELGTHTIVVTAPGHRDVRRTCVVEPGRNCDVDAQLYAQGIPVRIEANVAAARLFVDGESRGPVPWEGDLPEGAHEIEVRAEGYRAHQEQINLKPSRSVRLLQVILTPEAVAGVEARRKRESEQREAADEAVSHTAAPLPQGFTALDMSLGWPYLVELGLTTGITPYLDLGVSVGTFGRLTDFSLHTTGGYRVADAFSVGGRFEIGGGVGPAQNDAMGRHPTNDFFFSLEPIASVHFPTVGALSLWMAMDFNSDSWDFSGNDSELFVTTKRQNLVRGRFGGALDFNVRSNWVVWTVVEGIVAGKPRRVLGDVFGGGREDTKIYGSLGATYKFGVSGGGR